MNKKGASLSAESPRMAESEDAKADAADSRGMKKESAPSKPGAKGKEVKTWERSGLVPNTTKLMIGDREELPLEGMQVKIRIAGFRARVLIDCYYYNDTDRNYEGSFRLRLPDDASPYFFAFGYVPQNDRPRTDLQNGTQNNQQQNPDRGITAVQKPRVSFNSIAESAAAGFEPQEIMRDRTNGWEQVKEARMVPKEKAAFAYESTVRQNIDPALMEWSGAGVFNAKVFPMQPRRMHRIVIGYDMDLVPAGDALEYRFDIPKNIPASVIDLSVDRYWDDEPPMSIIPQGTLYRSPVSARDQSGSRGFISYRYENMKQGSIVLRHRNAGSFLLKGADPATGSYFSMLLRPELPKADYRPGRKRAVFMVDTSLSSNPDKFNVWMLLLDRILQRNADTLKEFSVLSFGIDRRWSATTFVPNDAKNRQTAREFVRSLALEGATDLDAALAEAVRPQWLDGESAHDIFLLSDGSVSWGENNAHVLAARFTGFSGSLFAYRTGLSETDTRMLDSLAAKSGGAVFSVSGEAEADEAAMAHRATSFRLLGVTIPGCEDVIVAGNPAAVYPGQLLRVSGRITGSLGDRATVSLKLKNAAGKEFYAASGAGRIIASPLAVRSYGQDAVRELENFEDATERYSKAYATHFRITGRTCSLLMLESEAEYQRYNIKPEEDAAVVKMSRASEIVAKTLAGIGDALSSRKKRLVAWLRKMEKNPATGIAVPDDLAALMDILPETAYAVKAGAIETKDGDWTALGAGYRDSLPKREIVYDDVVAEAARRRKNHSPADALKALSTLVENNPGDTVTVRDVAFSAMELGYGAHAYNLMRGVAESRPFEPQTYHAMAVILGENGYADLAMVYFEIALAGRWDSRFGDFKKIVLLDYLSLLRKAAAGSVPLVAKDFAIARLSRLMKESGVTESDLMVTIMWNTDNTDVDLHVIDPTKEECYYGHRETKMGGRLTQDVTRGYGPEMFLLPKAQPGEYSVFAHYYASNRNRASARSKVYAAVYYNWGRANERVVKKTVTLEYNKNVHPIETIHFQ
jgi:hypothetical protein